MFSLTILIYISSTFSMENPLIAPTSEEYELFKVVKKLREIAHESREEIRKALGFADRNEVSQSIPNKHYGQTRRGLLLVVDDVPISILSPWGEIPILQQKRYSSETERINTIAASQLFFKRVTATIAGFDRGWSRYHGKYHEVLKPITDITKLESALKRIPKKSLLPDYIGTNAIILGGGQGNIVFYRVMQADLNKVPKSQLYDYTKQERDPEEAVIVWKLMEEQYEKEKKS